MRNHKTMGNEEATYYPAKIMDKIKEANDIVDVISDFVPVKNYGTDVIGLCPFHPGDDYSLLISPQKQLYQCFECGANGDVFSFVMQYKQVSLREAAEFLAERKNIELPNPRVSTIGSKEREDTFRINKEAARYYYQNIQKPDNAGLAYLHDRGLTNHTISKFGIGYAEPNADDLYKFLKKSGFTDQQLEKSGLISFYNGRGVDKFKDRVMCPIVDADRNVLGFSGRVIGDGTPKYKNSPATLSFDKKAVLYGMNLAQNTKRKAMIVCEGNMDVISMHQAGFDNAVASLGTAFSKEHAEILSSYTDHIHLIFDSDEPGVKAALRALPIIREAGMEADIVHLEPYKDPDEFIKAEGAQKFDERLLKAEDSFAFEVRNHYKQYDLHDPEQTQNMFTEFGQSLIGMPEELKESYIQAMKDYIEHYDTIVSDGYYAPDREPSNIGISVVEEDGQDAEEAVPDFLEEPEQKQNGATVIDTSWLDEYTLN